MLCRCPELTRIPGVVHGFSGREEGSLAGRPASPNGKAVEGGGLTDSLRSWARVMGEVSETLSVSRLAVVNQVHGGEVLTVDEGKGPFSPLGDADALVTDVVGVTLAVRVADCVPVLLASEDGLVIGAVHSGWRGTAQGVVRRAVGARPGRGGGGRGGVGGGGGDERGGGAAVGPYVSAPMYEVSDEVVQRIEASGVVRERFAERRAGSWFVDLGMAVAAQLEEVSVARVDVLGACTAGSGFFSFRHDGPGTGRQAALIGRIA